MRPAKRNRILSAVLAGTAGIVFLPGFRAADDVRITLGHVLSDFNGPVPFGDPPLAADPASGEVLVGEGRDVKVFNEYGMQVFRLRTPYELATVIDLAVEPDGHVITLARDLEAPGDRPRIVVTRHDFRGVPVGEIEISDCPFEGFLPNRAALLGLELAGRGGYFAGEQHRDAGRQRQRARPP